jgi:hypothetical protein
VEAESDTCLLTHYAIHEVARYLYFVNWEDKIRKKNIDLEEKKTLLK